ncbi:protein-tyrosine phosphatase-like protein [Xylariomycetidae sp. FL2044]|nr:protein-tyrosine phosphatase-like protein [Xylariomycetidae sp. FL2044]
MTKIPTTTEEGLPSPPFHSIPGLPNFRDIGGYPISSSSSSTSTITTTTTTTTPSPPKKAVVRRGLVFRSSEPSRVSDAGVARLRALGIRTVYDLRSQVEIDKGLAGQHLDPGKEKKQKQKKDEEDKGEDNDEGEFWPIKEWEGSTRVFAPVWLDRDYSPESIALRYKNYSANSDEGFQKAYDEILTAGSSPNNTYSPFRKILTHLASSTSTSPTSPSPTTTTSPSSSPSSSSPTPPPRSTPTPILVHCTAGKDRTGVICALILSLCGVADDVVAHEYSLTDLGLVSRHQEFIAHLMRNPAMAGDPEGARRMIGARKEAMLGTLSNLRSRHGSIEKCVTDLGLLTAEGIAQLRRNLVVEVDEGENGGSIPIPWEAHAKLLL